jgi:prepilin-type N-terminal cleavage/methylation domain-containing protein
MNTFSTVSRGTRNQRGFTLIELMVSMAIFLVISSVAFRLFKVQESSASVLRDQVGLNLALRNSVTQLQLDVSNAGSGYFQAVNNPSWPVGVTISNKVVASGSSCYNSSSATYGPNCFDQLNVIAAADPTTYPPVKVTDSSGGNSPTANCSDTSTGVAYTQAAALVVNGVTTTWSLANTAAEFKTGDQVLFVNSTGSVLTSAVLTANGSVSGSAVQLTFNPTNADGSNSVANDPLDITACDGNSPCTDDGKLGVQFCGADYVIKLAPISYLVCAGPGSPSPCDQSSSSPDIQDPKLERVINGVASPVMEQVIGFRVGATIYNATSDNSTDSYQYDSACYTTTPDPTNPCAYSGTATDVSYNFTLVRSVRASIIARTTPNWNANYTYRNTFDGGPYQVQGMAVVVNPRNMSMND